MTLGKTVSLVYMVLCVSVILYVNFITNESVNLSTNVAFALFFLLSVFLVYRNFCGK
jgi:hypothetical protein